MCGVCSWCQVGCAVPQITLFTCKRRSCAAVTLPESPPRAGQQGLHQRRPPHPHWMLLPEPHQFLSFCDTTRTEESDRIRLTGATATPRTRRATGANGIDGDTV
jgi:hypothetical protein